MNKTLKTTGAIILIGITTACGGETSDNNKTTSNNKAPKIVTDENFRKIKNTSPLFNACQNFSSAQFDVMTRQKPSFAKAEEDYFAFNGAICGCVTAVSFNAQNAYFTSGYSLTDEFNDLASLYPENLISAYEFWVNKLKSGNKTYSQYRSTYMHKQKWRQVSGKVDDMWTTPRALNYFNGWVIDWQDEMNFPGMTNMCPSLASNFEILIGTMEQHE